MKPRDNHHVTCPCHSKGIISIYNPVISVVNYFRAALQGGCSTQSRYAGMTAMCSPALHRPISIMNSHMPLELIWSWKPFSTSSEGASKWSFTSVCDMSARHHEGRQVYLRVRICLVRFEASTNPLSQCGQVNGFSPLCVR